MADNRENVDEELRTYLTAMEDRLKAHVDERVNEVKSQVDERINEVKSQVDERINEVKSQVDERVNEVKSQVDERVNGVIHATAAEIGALHTYIQQVETRLTARIDAQGVRIDRHAGLLQSGARQLLRTFQNQEELSRLWREVDQRGSDLEKRLFVLERRPNGSEPLAAG